MYTLSTGHLARLATWLAAWLALSPLAGCQSTPPAPVAGERAPRLLSCPITLAEARNNLSSRGYTVAADAEGSERGERAFSTHFRRNDAETERYLLGSLALERERRYHVQAAAAGGLRFSVHLRETRHPHSEELHKEAERREFTPDPAKLPLARLEEMHREVCEMPAATPLPKPGLLEYVKRRCAGGDAEACGVLDATESVQ